DSAATAINDNGQLVGYSNYFESRGLTQAFYWRSTQTGPIEPLGTLPGGKESRALAINNRGEIVGWSDTASPGVQHAFLYRYDRSAEKGCMFDLNALVDPSFGCVSSPSTRRGSSDPPRCELKMATGINQAGQIVGVGRINGQDGHAFRLRRIYAEQRD